MDHFLPFYLPKNKKNSILKNKKNCWVHYHFTRVYQKPKSYEVRLLTYGERQNFLLFWIIFGPFTLTTWEIKILKKWKKRLEMSSFYTCVPKIAIWCMLPEIWSATDIIFYHFGPFSSLLNHYWPQKLKFGKNVLEKLWTINKDHMMYGSCDIRHNGFFFCHFGPFFTLWPPPSNNPKNNSEKMK